MRRAGMAENSVRLILVLGRRLRTEFVSIKAAKASRRLLWLRGCITSFMSEARIGIELE